MIWLFQRSTTLLLSLLALSFSANAQTVNPRPNVVIITWHDTGRWLGCYGVEEVHTPNIDQLAGEGFRFSNYFSPSSVCSPSRAAMLTGRYPQSNGCIGLAHPVQNYSIHPAETHLSELLRDQGYDTRLFGLQHETPHERVGEVLGFNAVYLNDPVPPCEQVVDRFATFLRQEYDRSRPLYAQIGFFETHRPFDFGGVTPDSTRGIHIPPYLQDSPRARREIALFQGSIRKADAQTGRVLKALAEAGMTDNTIVVFTIDHGAHFPRAKATNYDPGLEVALIMRWPRGGITGGKVSDLLLSHVDFFPTLLELLALPVPSNVQGNSFKRVFEEENPAPVREEIFAMFIENNRSIRTGRYKLIYNMEPLSTYNELPLNLDNPVRARPFPMTREGWPIAELFDLREDPHEFRNLYYEPGYRQVVQELTAKLWDWMVETDDPYVHGPMPTPWYERASDALKSNKKP